MAAAVTARLPAEAAHDAMITGRRYTAEEALALGIVTDTSDEARLLDLAIDLAAPIAGKDRTVIGEHKRLLVRRRGAPVRVTIEPRPVRRDRADGMGEGRVRPARPARTRSCGAASAGPDPPRTGPRWGRRRLRACDRVRGLTASVRGRGASAVRTDVGRVTSD